MLIRTTVGWPSWNSGTSKWSRRSNETQTTKSRRSNFGTKPTRTNWPAIGERARARSRGVRHRDRRGGQQVQSALGRRGVAGMVAAGQRSPRNSFRPCAGRTRKDSSGRTTRPADAGGPGRRLVVAGSPPASGAGGPADRSPGRRTGSRHSGPSGGHDAVLDEHAGGTNPDDDRRSARRRQRLRYVPPFERPLRRAGGWVDPDANRSRSNRALGRSVQSCIEDHSTTIMRDDYPTINEFNALAGELAEPFRVMVICDFPHKFNPISCGRLAQIVAHGARCGILTLIIADPGEPVPPGITLRELARRSIRLVWRDERLTWDDPDFEPFPLELEPLPPQALARRVLGKSRRRQPRGSPRRSAFRFRRTAARALVVGGLRPQPGSWPGQGRPDQGPVPRPGQEHGSTRLDRRPDRFGQVKSDACPDHQPGAQLQPG